FLHQLEPESPAYHVPAAVRVRESLNLAGLGQSLDMVRARHEVLRTCFEGAGGEPGQVIPPAQPKLPGAPRGGGLGALGGTEREGVVRRLAAEEARRPFDLARGPLLRSRVLRLSPREHVLLMTMHHIASDGWSMGVLMNEMGELHDAFTIGRPPRLAELPVQ